MEKLEYYTVEPNLKQIYGKRVTKDTVFDEQIEDGSITQHFENLTLTTTIKKQSEAGAFKYEEESKISVTMPENTILIWSEESGFIIPECKMTTLEDLVKEIHDIEDIYNNPTE